MTDKLRQAAQQMLEWFNRNTYADEAVDVYQALETALAEQPVEQEPVAVALVRPLEPDESERRVTVKWVKQPITGPLYTAPQPAKREPLTEAQICSTLATAFPDDAGPDGSWKLAQYELDIFRLAERAHGIGEQP